VKIYFVDAPSFIDRLNKLFINCTKLDIAMAYVRSGGLDSFLDALKKSILMQKNMPIRILFGMCSSHGITDKESAKRLLKLTQQHQNIKVKKYDNPGFHPKLMIFYGNPAQILVGSSNLTAGAQSKNAEANVIVEDPDQKFMKDAVEFFEMYFDKAPYLEPRYVDLYTPLPTSKKRRGQRSSMWDELPSRSKRLSPLINRRRGIGSPIKTKSYYDEKIRDLESKKLTEQQKKSLAAYRALRTRYFGGTSRQKQPLAVLVAVTHGTGHLETIVEEGHGTWEIGRQISKDHSSEISDIYFYENQRKKSRYKGTIKKVQHDEGKTCFSITNLKKLDKSRKLGSFKKRNGENVSALQCFAYVHHPGI